MAGEGDTLGEGPAAQTPALGTICPDGIGKLALFGTLGTCVGAVNSKSWWSWEN